MSFSATFIFYGSLIDFLPRKKREPIPYIFTGTPSVKDAIETIGIPHVEVDVKYTGKAHITGTWKNSSRTYISYSLYITKCPKSYKLYEIYSNFPLS